MNTQPPRKRRRYWIDPTIQGRIMLQWLILSLIIANVTAIACACFVLVRDAGPDDGQLWRPEYAVFFAVLFLVIFGLLIVGLFESHRMVGPLKRLSNVLPEVGKGILNIRVKFRKHDPWHDLADRFNTCMDDLTTKVRQDRQQAREVCDRLQALARQADSAELQQELQALAEKAETITSEYTIS